LREGPSYVLVAIAMAFPQRQTQQEFLQYYGTLKDDDEEKGIDLAQEGNDEDEDEDEGETGLLDDLLDDKTKVRSSDLKSHKELDAEARAAEERAMEEVARRFESRGGQARPAEEEEDYTEVDAIKAEQREQAREAQRKAAAATAARLEAEREKEAKRLKEKSKAMSALYDLYAEDDEDHVEKKSAAVATPAPKPVAKPPKPRPPPSSLPAKPPAAATKGQDEKGKAPLAKRRKVESSSSGGDLLDSIMGGMDRTVKAPIKKRL